MSLRFSAKVTLGKKNRPDYSDYYSMMKSAQSISKHVRKTVDTNLVPRISCLIAFFFFFKVLCLRGESSPLVIALAYGTLREHQNRAFLRHIACV